jgi:hypothetical protein
MGHQDYCETIVLLSNFHHCFQASVSEYFMGLVSRDIDPVETLVQVAVHPGPSLLHFFRRKPLPKVNVHKSWMVQKGQKIPLRDSFIRRLHMPTIFFYGPKLEKNKIDSNF